MPDLIAQQRTRWDQQFENLLGRYGLSNFTPRQVANVLVDPLQAQAEAEALQDDLYDRMLEAYGGPIIGAEDQVAAAHALVMEQKWGAVDENLARQSPELANYLATYSDSERGTALYNYAFNYLHQFYGDEYLAPFMQTALNGNLEQQTATLEILESFANEEIMAEGSAYLPAQADPTYHINPELLQQVIANPEMFDSLSVQDKLEVKAAANQAITQFDPNAMYAGPEGQTQLTGEELDLQAQDVSRIVGMLNTGKFKLALTQEELNLVNELGTEDAQTSIAGRINLGDSSAPGELDLDPRFEEVGLISLSGRGDSGFRMDDEWVQANPVKAVAVIELLKMRFPDTKVIIGKSGAVGDVFEMFGMSPDFIGGSVGGGLQQANELFEQWTGSQEDRQKAALEAQRLKDNLKNGLVAREDLEEVNNKINELEDAANVNVGLGEFKNDVRTSLMGAHAGTGFVSTVLDGVGYMPGDAGYDGVAAITGLIGSIAFDPLTWAGGFLRADKYARMVPRTADDIPRVSKGLLTQYIYSKIAKTPEELIATKPYQKAIQKIWDSKQSATDLAKWEAKVMQNFNVSPEVARMFGSADSLEDMQLSVLRSMVGSSYNSDMIVSVKNRLDAAKSSLDRMNRIPVQLAQLRRQLGARKGIITKSERKLFEIEDTVAARVDELDQRLAIGDITDDEWQAELNLITDEGRALTEDANFSIEGLQQQRLDRIAIEDEIRELESQMSTLAHDKADVVAEYLWARDVYEGRDWVRPMTQAPSAGALRKLYDPENLGSWDSAYLAMTEATARIGGRTLERLGAKRLLNHLQTKEGQLQEAAIKESFVRAQHWVMDTPQGQQIFFPSTTLNPALAKVLRRQGITDVTEHTIQELAQNSFNDISNFFKLLGHNDETVADLMKGWTEIGSSKARAYEWWKSAWGRAIDESPMLTRSSKDELAKMWDDVADTRGPGFIPVKRSSVKGTLTEYDDTLYSIKPDPNNPGQFMKSPTPAFHPDMLQTYRIPSYNELKKHLSFTSRTLASMKKGGLGRKFIAYPAYGVGVAWVSGVNLWKNIVLLGKMPVSLPVRIWTEEMMRMAAFDYSSALRNPWGWFKSVRSADEFELFANSPTGLLGVMEDQLRTSRGVVKSGKEVYRLADAPDMYFRSMSGLVNHRISKETKYLLKYLNDPKGFLKWYDEAGKNILTPGWMDHIDDIVGTTLPGQIPNRLEAIKRIQAELKGIIGRGPNAFKIKKLLSSGRIEIDGVVYQAGSDELAPVLHGLFADGKWTPEVPAISGHYADFLPLKDAGTMETMRRAADWMFKYFYSTADTSLARSPLFRQIASREYSRWTRLGYAPDTAKELSVFRAAERTRDLMFEIGAHSPAEVTIRSLMPFFPAWRELATTWLYRIPKQYGGGKWAVGSVIFANRVNDYLTFLNETGLVGRNEDGNWVAPNPLAGVLNTLFGEPNLVHEINAESLAGLLPVPGLQENPNEESSWAAKLKGFSPTFGAPASIVVGKAGDAWGGLFKDVSDMMTFYGADTSLGPAAIDRMLESVGITPPWMTLATQQYHQAQRQWAIIDGMKIEIEQNPPPPVPEGFIDNPDIQKKYYEDYNAWLDTALEEAEEYATTSYVLKGLISALSPVAMSWEPEREKEYEALRGLLNNIPGESLDSPMLEIFKNQNPGAYAFLTSKTIDLHPDLGVDVQDFEKFQDEVLSGMREQLTPSEFARFSYGMNSFFIYLNQKSLAYKELGDTAGDVLSQGYEKKATIDKLDASWENFLALQESMPTEDGGRTFTALFDIWSKARQDEQSLSLEQSFILDLKNDMGNAALLMSPQARDDLDWGNANSALSESLGNVNLQANSEIGKGISWWWDNVGTPYLEETSAVWDQINKTEKGDRGPLYEKLRAIENKYYTEYKSKRFGTMPSPQEAFFSNMSPEQQDIRLREMAQLPVPFLNEFYRAKLGYDTAPAKKLNELASFLNKVETAFDEQNARLGISSNSYEGQARARQFEALKLRKAQELGLAEEYALWTAPTYQRMDAAFGLSEKNLLWSNVVNMMQGYERQFAGSDYSLSGSSDAAKVVQRHVVTTIDQYRKNDDSFDKIMTQFEEAYGEPGQPLIGADMYMKLFFDYFFDSAPDYI